MKKILRYLGAILFILVGLGSFALFEYWKLLEADSRFVTAGAISAAAFLIGFLLFQPLKEYGFARCLKTAGYLTLGIVVLEGGFLKLKSRSDLNHVIEAKGRCESVLVELFGDNFDGGPKAAQNACTLRILQNQLASGTVSAGEEKIGIVARLLLSENRLNETTLVLLLSDYSNLENKLNAHAKGETLSDLDLLKNEFSFVEGALPILEIYQVKALFEGGLSSNMEARRLKKLLELSTLGKTLGIFLGRARGASQGYEALLKGHGATLESGELTLLGIRIQKIKEGYNRVLRSWNLAGALESLNVKETYPGPYQKVLGDVSLEAL